jgi:hypothetical protein
VYGKAAGGYGIDTAEGYGVYGTSTAGRGGVGVWGEAAASVGVFGTDTNSGTGVKGTSSGGIGVQGYANGSGAKAVVGSCAGTGCWGGYFYQDVFINGTTYPPSDIRFKKNVAPVTGAIDQLLKLKGVTFEWKEPEKHNGATSTQIGFIAQEVEKVFPDWVRTDEAGFKALSVAQVEALEVESIRTLKAQNDELRARVEALEANRHPVISGLTAEGTLFGFGFVGMAGAFVVSRRKRLES